MVVFPASQSSTRFRYRRWCYLHPFDQVSPDSMPKCTPILSLTPKLRYNARCPWSVLGFGSSSAL